MAARLQAHRKRCGLSFTDVARAVGVPISTYRDWETGREIRGEPYLKLAQVFGISLAELIGGPQFARNELLDEMKRVTESLERIRSAL